MSEKNFCESGKHDYREIDVVKSVIEGNTHYNLVACSKCDSKFLREVRTLL